MDPRRRNYRAIADFRYVNRKDPNALHRFQSGKSKVVLGQEHSQSMPSVPNSR